MIHLTLNCGIVGKNAEAPAFNKNQKKNSPGLLDYFHANFPGMIFFVDFYVNRFNIALVSTSCLQ